VILDASAVLALLQGETGAEHVREALRLSVCHINAVNLTEVAGKLMERLGNLDQVRALLAIPGLETLPVTEENALVAAELTVQGKALGLSLGDRLCLASGLQEKALVLTADQIWLQLGTGPKVELIR
jgi:PIN domain nuclease of toxin-antitoxin system